MVDVKSKEQDARKPMSRREARPEKGKREEEHSGSQGIRQGLVVNSSHGLRGEEGGTRKALPVKPVKSKIC